MQRFAVIALLLSLALPLGLAGANYRFQHLGSVDGLPHQEVEALAQDRSGCIWIGTRNGLSKFDGYGICTYYHDESNPNSLCHNFIHNLHVDTGGRLWVCTETGLCRYRPDSDDFRCYDFPKGFIRSIAENSKGILFFGGDRLYTYDEGKDGFTVASVPNYGMVISLAVDKDDNLFVSSSNAIYRLDPGLALTSPLDRSLYEDCLAGSNIILPMAVDSRNRLWIGRNGKGLLCFDLGTEKTTIYPAKDISNGVVRTIIEDYDQRIWAGTENGITIIGPDGDIEILRHRLQDGNCLGDNAIYSILCDSDRNIWIGSYFGGVDYLTTGSLQFRLHEPGHWEGDMKSRVARMMVEVSPRVFWIATEDGGINIFNAETGRFDVFDDIPDLGTNIHSLYHDKETDEIWIGTRFNGLFRYNPKTKAAKHYLRNRGQDSEGVFDIRKTKGGDIWIATMGGLKCYDPDADFFFPVTDEILKSAFIYSLFVDRDDNLWVATVNHGVFTIDTRSGMTTHIEHDPETRLKDDYIICVFQDSEGTVWIGTNNNGLQFIDKATGKVRSFDGEAQVSQSTICSITEDSDRNLWICTSKSLCRYSLDTHSISLYSPEDGLPVDQFNFSASLLASDGSILLGTINGLISFNPRDIEVREGPFPVHFKSLTINNLRMVSGMEGSPLKHQLDETEDLRLRYSKDRSFCIEYGVILPASTSSIRYQVRVKGIDKGWRDVGSERRFYGYNLQPGRYSLNVRANNTNEGWDSCPVKSILITIEPPLYRSNLAYLLYAMLACGIAWLSYTIIKGRMEDRDAVRMATMEKMKIEEIDRTKSSFFTIVTHELKTPLSLIVAPLKGISKKDLDAQSQAYLDTAIKNTCKMEDLIRELITFNKVESDSFPFYVQKGNPLEFIRLAARPFKDSCEEKDVGFSVECEDNGEEVWFSPAYLEHILDNLLSNALKFTFEGGSVSVKALVTGLDGDPYTYLRIDVSDTGIGIAREELQDIFVRYYQTGRGQNADSSGWGIGLALVKRLVEIHKGSISVESQVGKGSTFSVLLNVSGEAFDAGSHLADDKAIVPVSNYHFKGGDIGRTDEIPDGGKRRILFVDDNPDMLDFLREYFSGEYHVVTATDGGKALETALKGNIELVVSDVMMPGMDGTELCRALKKGVETSHIPVILLSAKGEADDVVSGYRSGADAYVPKPFDPRILELQIRNIIELIKARQDEAANYGNSGIGLSSLGEIDKGFVRRIFEVVEENIANSEFSVGDITRELGISRTLLYTKMKSLMDISTGDFIRKRRIDKACKLLKEGYNVSEAAYAIGFSDPNYFSKVFKKSMGVSPSEY